MRSAEADTHSKPLGSCEFGFGLVTRAKISSRLPWPCQPPPSPFAGSMIDAMCDAMMIVDAMDEILY